MAEQGEQTIIKSQRQIERERSEIGMSPLMRSDVMKLGGPSVALTVLGITLKLAGAAALGSVALVAAGVWAAGYLTVKALKHMRRFNEHYRESMDTLDTDMREPWMKRLN